MDSFYKCESGGRTVTVWPTVTGESGFYDAVVTDGGDDIVARIGSARTLTRLTAYEAASVVTTELGAPMATTLDALTGMIVRWRAEFDALVREPAS